MGIFDKIKKGLGMSAGTFELRLAPQGQRVGGQIEGQLVMRAHRPLNVFSVELDLVHGFTDEYGHKHQETVEGLVLAERVAFAAEQEVAWPFHIPIAPQLAPSMVQFSWALHARARTQDAGVLQKTQPILLRPSPMCEALVGIVQQGFGFKLRESGADEDGLWFEFSPGASIRGHFQELELSIDEDERELELWVRLVHFSPAALKQLPPDARFDRHEGAVTLNLEKRRYVIGPEQIDTKALLERLRPLFALS